MENAIPTLVIGALMLVASALMTRGNLQSYDQMTNSLREMEARMSQRAQSQLLVTGAALDPELDTLFIDLSNEGQVRIDAYPSMDVILIYETAAGRVTEWLPFSEGALSADTWNVESISEDFFEPGLLNPGETAHLVVELLEPALAGHSHRIVIVSDAGAITSAPFTS